MDVGVSIRPVTPTLGHTCVARSALRASAGQPVIAVLCIGTSGGANVSREVATGGMCQGESVAAKDLPWSGSVSVWTPRPGAGRVYGECCGSAVGEML